MIIIALIASALTLYLGYQWGFEKGQTEIERKVLRHVINSPEYGNQIVDAIKKSLARVKK